MGKNSVIAVDFGYGTDRRDPPMKRHGGCGTLSLPDPYSGPAVREVSSVSWRRQGVRTYRITRLEVSPTGSCHGSFRIEEVTEERGNEKLKHIGFNCSWPDFDACDRIASGQH